MDNAPYHCIRAEKSPTSSSKKGVLQCWLRKNNILFNDKATKRKLLSTIKPILDHSVKKYVVDELLIANGYSVLRLPPYHCQYNPIELMWGYCKTYYNRRINSLSGKDRTSALWSTALNDCDNGMWRNAIKHCEDLIDQDWKNEWAIFQSTIFPLS
mgnify:FL=1